MRCSRKIVAVAMALPLLAGCPGESPTTPPAPREARYSVTLEPATLELADNADSGLDPSTPLASLAITVDFFGETISLEGHVLILAGRTNGDERAPGFLHQLPGRLAYLGGAGPTQGDLVPYACDLPVLATVKNNPQREATVIVPLGFLAGAGPLAPEGTYPIALSTRLVTWDSIPAGTGGWQVTEIRCGQDFTSEPTFTLDVVASPPPPPQGTTITWTGAAGTSDWRTAGNWDLNRIPTAGDDVVIDAAFQVALAGGDQDPAIEVERLLLTGELSVSGGAGLDVALDIDGPDGTLRVLSGPSGSRPSFLGIGAASSLSALELSGRLQQAGPVPPGQTFDDKPVLEVGEASFSTVSGYPDPTIVGVQLRASGSATVDGDLDLASVSTLEILGGAELIVSGAVSGTIGTSGQFIGSSRLINHGIILVQVQGITVNSRLENHGTITLDRNATFTARGENRGTIRSLGVLGLGTLTLQGRIDPAPHWTLESSSIVEENFRTVTVQAGSVLGGRLSADRLTLEDAPNAPQTAHVLDLAQMAIDTLTANAGLVDANFTGTFNVARLVVADTLRLPDFGAVGSDVMRAEELVLQGGAVLQGKVLEAGDVQLGPAGPALPITLQGRLWITGTASAANVTVIGAAGWMELRGGLLDLNPGSANAVEFRPERPGVGVDLQFRNDGVIQKRGAGPASITACFGPSGPGTVSNVAGATPMVIATLMC